MNDSISLTYHQAQAVAERAERIRTLARQNPLYYGLNGTERVIVTLGNPYYNEPPPENHGLYLTIEGRGGAPVPMFAKDLGRPRTFDAARLPARDEDGHVNHPDMDGIGWDEFDMGPQLRAIGWHSTTVSFESDASDEAQARYDEGNSPDCSYWTPTTPGGDGWLMTAIYDTEDGPVALFVKRAADPGEATPAPHLSLCASQDDTLAGHPACDCGTDWQNAERISNLPAVEEAIRNLLADQTGDNATGLVRAVLDAAGVKVDGGGHAD